MILVQLWLSLHNETQSWVIFSRLHSLRKSPKYGVSMRLRVNAPPHHKYAPWSESHQPKKLTSCWCWAVRKLDYVTLHPSWSKSALPVTLSHSTSFMHHASSLTRMRKAFSSVMRGGIVQSPRTCTDLLPPAKFNIRAINTIWATPLQPLQTARTHANETKCTRIG